MKKNLKKFIGMAALGLTLALPAVIHADDVTLMANVGDDDEAHFHFKGQHHPLIFKAAVKLREAKHSLWAAGHDFGGHEARAIIAIDHALDELAQADDYANSH